jgi:Nif-specific regulatory protein
VKKEVYKESDISQTTESVLINELPSIKYKNNELPNLLNDVILRMTARQRIDRISNCESIIDMLRGGKEAKKRHFIEKLLYSDFIGREKYLDKIFEFIKKTADGKGQILFIEGLCGTGKTRLLTEIEHRLLLNNENVRFVNLLEESNLDKKWLLDILEITGSDSSVLKLKVKKKLSIKQENLNSQLLDQIAKAIERLRPEKIHAFLLDDANLEDDQMAKLVRFLSTEIGNKSCIFIATTESIPEQLRKIIESGIYKNITSIELGGFTKDETIPFVKNILGILGNVEKLTDFIFEVSNGNPFFIEELLKKIIEKKLLTREGSNLSCSISKIKETSIPDSIISFVSERIRNFPEEEYELLKLSSVLGNGFPVSWLVDLSPYNDSKTIGIIEKQSFRQFASITEKDNLLYNHKAVRDAIYGLIGEKDRKKYHKKVIDFLEKLKESNFILEQKAHHSFYVDSHRAEKYLAKLLKKAIKENNAILVIEYFEKLQALGKEICIPEYGITIIQKVANFYYHTGELEKAISLLSNLTKQVKKKSEKIKTAHLLAMMKLAANQHKEAEQTLRNLLKNRLPLENEVEVLIDLGWLQFKKKEYKKADLIYQTAHTKIKNLKRKDLLGKLYYNLSLLRQDEKKLGEAKQYGHKLLDIAKAYKNKNYVLAGEGILASTEQIERQYDKSITHYKKILKLLRKTEDLPRKLHTLSNLARLLFSTGEIEESKDKYFCAVAEAKRLGNLYEICLLYNLYGKFMTTNGNFQEAIHYILDSDKIARLINELSLQIMNASDISFIYSIQGKTSLLRKLNEKVKLLKNQITSEKDFLCINLMQGIQNYNANNFEGAMKYFSSIEETVEKIKAPEYQIPSLVFQCLCLIKLNENERAKMAIDEAERLMTNSKMLLHKNEIEFAGLLIRGKDFTNSVTKGKLHKLLERTRKNHGFLSAKIMCALAELEYKDFKKGREESYLFESILLLRKARRIFEDTDAKLQITKTNEKLLKIYEMLIDGGKQLLREKEYMEITSKFEGIVESFEDPERLKSELIAIAKILTGAERGLFLTFDGDRNELLVTGREIDDSTIFDVKKFSKNVIRNVSKSKKPLIVDNAINDERFKNMESVRINQIRSILCIPILSKEEVLGTLYLDSKSTTGLFSEADRKFLDSLVRLLASSLSKAMDFKRIKEESRILKKNVRIQFGPENLVGKSDNMQRIFDKIEKFARCDMPVLILGETGTGKELIARSIHFMSKRQENSFLVVDCSIVSDSLVESELFGYKKGAFTGALKDNIGHFEAADKGTIFIDEIANSSESLQAKLLRFLDRKEVKRIGETSFRKVNTRALVASNKDLHGLMKQGKFREDLFHRLSKFAIRILPLRERKEDIRLLIDYFIGHYNSIHNKRVIGFEKRAFELLYYYEWPGNVRELRNEIDRCVFFCNKKIISFEYLSPEICESKSFLSLKEKKRKIVDEHTRKVLSYTKGNIGEAAKILKTSKKTIYRILNRIKLKVH